MHVLHIISRFGMQARKMFSMIRDLVGPQRRIHRYAKKSSADFFIASIVSTAFRYQELICKTVQGASGFQIVGHSARIR